ncbi:alpha/beta fold hydrolase [Peristeroidobacter agariperforans]|uniref:alpha/beta fold hydrolase n=1 Tax=Peristeroidobacter agariperforans TaxID=268404 RepID=UPI00101B9108|nr:alpha/beta hydrolase [Peristeroidobacter agariperforans]
MNRRLLIQLCSLLALNLSAATAVFADGSVDWKTQSVQSKDGTRVVYQVMGKGSPLMILHGGWSSAEAYKPLGKLLASDYQVVLVERRNYGVSGTGPRPHSFLRDGEDVHAVIDALGRDVYLFGHSGGGLAALHAVLVGTDGIKKLAVYEPPITAGGPSAGDVLQRYEGALKDKNYDAAVKIGLRDLIGYPDAVTQQLASIYKTRLQAANWNGAVYDVEGLRAMRPDANAWAALRMPALLIVGERSNEHPLLDSSRALKAVIRGSTLVTLAGQEHSACALAPEMVASELRKFFGP